MLRLRSTYIPTVLTVLGAWSIAVPFVGPHLGLKLDVARSLEVIDHVIPGLVIVAAGVALWVLLRRGHDGDYLLLAFACLSCLGGAWITATHVPLLVDAGRGRTPLGTALFHIATGPPILALSLWLALPELREPPGDPDAPPPRRS